MPIRDLHLCFRADPALQVPRMIKNSDVPPTEADLLRDLVTAKVAQALADAGVGAFKRHGHGCLGFNDGEYTITSIFAVDDFERAEIIVRKVIDAREFKGKVDTHHWFEDRQELDEPAPFKSIEVYYDVAAIPDDRDPLDFREAACVVIEGALMDAEAGEWAGAESGMGEVNFGFEVEDFERAEKIVRAAVKGTPYADIREITRFSYPEDKGPSH